MPHAKSIRVLNRTNQTVVAEPARKADTFRSRLRGLLGSPELAFSEGLLLVPSSGVHTLGMKYSIDIVALDKGLRVIGIWESVGPGKVRGLGLGAHSVLELKSGRARECGVALGDQLHVQPVFTPQAV
ncbi:MAG: DUF192 domain-containing protein [Janthinobacterium lividum]